MMKISIPFLAVGLLSLGGCGVAPDSVAQEVASVSEEVAIPVLWKCNTACTNTCNKPGCKLQKTQWISCETSNTAAALDGDGECKKAYGPNSKADCPKCSMVKPMTKCELPPGGGWGDPHMTTLDGVNYEFQPLGEFVLATDRSTFEIQARTEQYSSTLTSVFTAVAIKIGSTNVSLYVRESPQFRINGEPGMILGNGNMIPSAPTVSGRLDLENGAYLKYDAAQQKYSIYLTDEVSHLDVWMRGSYMNVTFFAGPAHQGVTSGLIGNGNGDRSDDFRTRDGRVLVQPIAYQTMYDTFANSWRIDETESLFTYQGGRDTFSFSNVNFPRAMFTAAELPTEDRTAARQSCVAAGVPANRIEECTLDVTLIGPDVIADYLNIGKF